MDGLKLIAVGLCLSAFTATAAIRITPATGGEAISADTAANGVSPAWTTLGPITLKEKNFGHRFRFTPGTNQTLVLKAPAGFQFNTEVTPSLTFAANKDISAASLTVGTNTLKITFTVPTTDAVDEIVIGGSTAIQVQPTSSYPVAKGKIYRPAGAEGGTAVIRGLVPTSNPNGIGFNSSDFGTLIEVPSTAVSLKFKREPSARAIAGLPFGKQPIVAVADQYGNIRTNESGRIIAAQLFSGPGNLIGITNLTMVNGVAAFGNLGASDAGTITVSFSTANLTSILSGPIVVDNPREPAVATSLDILVQPSNVSTAGVAFAQQPVVAVLDQYDYPITNDNSSVITASRAAGSGALQGTVDVVAANGIATFTDLSHNIANTITLLFSSPEMNSAVSDEIEILPTVADRLAFSTQPAGASIGAIFGQQPIVSVVDVFGNASTIGLASNLVVTVALTSGSGTLAGTTSQDVGTDVGFGLGVFTDLMIDAAGTNKQLTASAPGMLSGTSEFFKVSGNAQVITFDPLPDKTYGDAPFSVSAAASSGLPVTFDVVSGPATILDGVVTILGAGEVTIRASQGGDDNYDSAPDVDRTFNVGKADQVISFDTLATKTYGDDSFTISAEASSGLPVTFVILSGPATVSGNNVSIGDVGTVVIRASQSGDDNYLAAPDVDQSFEVSPASLVVTATDASRMFKSPNPDLSGSIVGLKNSDNITANYTTDAALESVPGNYPINVSLNDPDNRLGNYLVTTNIGTLEVTPYPLPLIANHPSGITNFQGSDVNLSAGVTGHELSYQWRCNGTNIAGATSATYEMPHARITSSGQYDCVISNPSGSVTSDPANVDIRLIPCDFDENRQADIVFQSAEGRLALWFMDGTNYLGAKLLRNGKRVGAGWRLMGENDFNSDGHTDLLFQNTNGKLAVWMMNGTNFVGSTLLRGGKSVGGTWRVASVVDLNNDRRPDILFQNEANQLAVWYLNGLTLIGSGLLRDGRPVGGGWKVVGVRDFNGDELNDILFQNADGRLAIWYMNGSTYLNGALLRRGPNANSGWKIVGVSDYDHDNNIDILWQQKNGRTAIWTLEGNQFVEAKLLRNGQRTSPNWQIVGAK